MALTVGSAGLAHSIPASAEAFDLGRAPSAGAERPLLSSAPLGDPFTVTGTGAFERIAVATSADWVGSEIVVAPADWDGTLADLIPSSTGGSNVAPTTPVHPGLPKTGN